MLGGAFPALIFENLLRLAQISIARQGSDSVSLRTTGVVLDSFISSDRWEEFSWVGGVADVN